MQVQNQVTSLSSQIPSGILERALEAASKTTTLNQPAPHVDVSVNLTSSGLGSPVISPPVNPMSTMSSSSGQMVQVMTSQGLRTFQLSTGSSAPIIATSPLGASSTATKSTSILTRAPEASKMVNPSQSLLLSPNRLPSKPLLPKVTHPHVATPLVPQAGSSLLGKVGSSLLQTAPTPNQPSLMSPRPQQGERKLDQSITYVAYF